jgi:hypothetical protein
MKSAPAQAVEARRNIGFNNAVVELQDRLSHVG